MLNPGPYSYDFGAQSFWVGIAIIASFVVALLGSAIHSVQPRWKLGARIAVGGIVCMAVSFVLLVIAMVDSSGKSDAHSETVHDWLTSEHDIDATPDELDALLDYESVKVTVDGEKRFAALADDDGALVLLLDDRD
jgi:hypothetical protein